MNFKLALMAAAVVGAATTAQAADLAKKAPAAANYVKVCDAYGAGFFYIPGSDTCLKIGGYVQAQYTVYGDSKEYNDQGSTTGWNHRSTNGLTTNARAHLNFDARSNTEFGLLRSYIDLEINTNSYAGTSIATKKAFIQFGGLTAGRATSFFDFFNGDYVQSVVYEASHSDANVNLLAYTFSFGNGITASLSIEDPSTADDNGRRNIGYGYYEYNSYYGMSGGSPYGGVHTPDLVGNVNITQAWGSAQIMGALHDDYAASTYGSADKSKLGFAVGAGVKINVPALGPSDQVALQVEYAKGAIGYIGYLDTYTAVDFYTAGDEVYQSSSWAVSAGFQHEFTKTISASIEASYADFKTDDDGGYKGDFKQVDVIADLTWSPVTNFSVIGEVGYRNVDYSSDVTAYEGYTPADKHGVIGAIRVKRSF